MDAKIWVLVSTALFVGAVAKPVARAIGGGLGGRSERIRHELQEATRLKEEAQSLLAQYQRKQEEMAQESAEMLMSAKQQAKDITDAASTKLEEDLERRTKLAMQKIATMEEQAMQDIRARAVEVTIEATKELITEHLGSDVADDLMKSAIKEVERKFH